MRLLKGKEDFWITVGAVLGILVVVAILVSLVVVGMKFVSATNANTALTKHSIAVGNGHHRSTAKKEQEIIALQKANHALGEQHSADIANASQLLMSNLQADSELNALGVYIAESNLANCANSAASARASGAKVTPCPPLPKITSLPTTTTTTEPK